MTPDDWRSVAASVDAAIRDDPTLAHTADLVVAVDGHTIWAASYQPGELRDVFSITKTALGLLVGIAVEDGMVVLDEEVEADVTVRHLLAMQRGAATDIEDIDRVMELPTGWIRAIRDWPRVEAAGQTFRYDNNGAHLLAAHLTDRVGMDLAEFAQHRLLGPLGIEDVAWPADPEGYRYGFGHLRLPVSGLLAIGELMRARGTAADGRRIVPSAWVDAMTTPTSPGGPPEHTAYGLLTWVDRLGFFAGGWAGQHLTVLPTERAVVVTTGLPELLGADWRPARSAVVDALSA